MRCLRHFGDFSPEGYGTRSNPPISPAPEDNIWKFETRNMGDNSRVDCNFDVPGFKIYGRFRNAQVHAWLRRKMKTHADR